MWKLFRDFCFILLCFTNKNVQCFNFDTNFPIVYIDPHNFSNNPLDKSSYFGYSVLLYEGTPNNNPWIQIGAPRGRNPNWGNELTGIVFRCGIKSKCYHVNLLPEADDGYASEAYFGNSMDISNDKSIYAVCGHRWIEKKTTDYYMEGACFGGKTTENDTTFYKPLHRQLGHLSSISNVRVYNTAQAQLGFSAQFAHSKENDLLIGLPGLLNWKGGAGLLSKATPPEASRRRRRRSIDDLESAFIPDVVNVDDIKFFDLAGYSVTSGKFYNNGELYYVTGAPRAALKGSVLIYRFVKSKMTIFERKDGNHVGEYFGSAVTASDINGDGLDDLIVGAPFHKTDTSESKYDGGAIYVYVGSRTGDKLTDASTNIIKGKTDGGRFGEAVMSLGDIDKDGFADIAVAAPYDNDNSGVVYIFRGNEQSGLIKEPSQIIKGKDIIPNIRGFGISLSKPADIDGNKYSDLAIGAYKSGHAVLLRGKPVVVLDHNLTSSINQISASNIASSFEITSCVAYHGVDIEGITEVNIRRVLSVDKGVSERAYLENTTNFDSRMDVPNQAYCSKYVVKIRPSTNIYDPIVIRGYIELIKPVENKRVITVTDKVDGTDEFCSKCAIPRSTADTDRQINVDFNRECGSDNICDAFLHLSARFTDLMDEKYVIGSKEYITLEAMVSNSNENAFQTEVLITLPSPVRLKRIPPNCKESSAEIACTIDNPLKKDATKTVSLELDVDEINTGKYDADLPFSLRVKTSSNNTGDSEKTLSLGLVKRADIELKGVSAEETYSYINRTYGKATFQQVYKILKYDISPIQRAKLTVNIPTSVTINGKEIKFLSLYAPEGSLAGQSITCQSSIETIMDNNVPVVVGDADKKKRKRREVATIDEQLSKYPANRTIYFNCSSESITEGTVCGTVTCDFGPLKNIKNTAEIRFKMILDISELTDYKPDKDIVIVSTSGRAQIVDNVISNGAYSHEVSVPSVFIGPSAEQSIALWIIIVAIICGILLLALLAGGLYKLGFFKREKKAMLMEEKAKQNAEETATEPLTTGAQT